MNPITKAHLEGVEALYQTYFYKDAFGEEIKTFLTTYGINLLQAAKKAGPRERTVWGIEQQKWSNEGFNSCISSFHSAIDEGIEGIRKGNV